MDEQTKHAIELAKSGKVNQGFIALQKIVTENPSNVAAWYAISCYTSDISLKRKALETVLKLVPNHPEAKADFDKLTGSTVIKKISAQPSAEPSPQILPTASVSKQLERSHPDYTLHDYADLDPRIDELETKLDDLNESVANVIIQIGSLDERLDSHVDAIENLGEGLDNHAGIINNLVDMVNRLARYSHSHGHSDMALKENVAIIENALERILSIRGVSFTWMSSQPAISLGKSGRDFGVIAQEVAAVFPELVATNSESGLLMVDYQGIVPVLIEAIRQQQVQIDELRSLLQAQGQGSIPNPQVH